ncbi:RNA methyltransferase [Candidatus Sumerlaeota bacterium]|nr:RNA methyltransferase [Candidatus Sumerlaeota bacterium]
MKIINSTENSEIKYLKRLQESGGFRKEERKFLIEGPPSIKSLLERGIRPLQVYISSEMMGDADYFHKSCEQFSIPVTELSAKCYMKISVVETPQGLAALFAFPEPDAENILQNKEGLFLCCHGIQDPGNMGAMIRTADAAGASAVIAIPPSVSFYNPKTVRASAGSILSLPCIELEEAEFITVIKKRRINLYAAVPREGAPFHLARFQRPLCILIGSEAHGLPEWIQSRAKLVTIPMRNAVESLNAAVSAAILLYQASRENGK